MDQRVSCPGCNQSQSRKNISRHLKLCKKMIDLINDSDEKSRSRSSSRDTGCSGSVSVSETQHSHAMRYSPTSMSAMLMSIIQEAVEALLEQHNCYDVSQLTTYLGTYYPEIPENFRAPIVIAAATAARQAAQFHYVWQDNHNSHDGHKRHYAASAASSLSFWALGLRSASRSGSVYDSQASSSVTIRPQEVAVTAPVSSSAVASEAVVIPESSASTVRCLELPVPIDDDDPEFNELLGYYQGQAQHPLLSPVVSLVGSGTVPIVSTLAPEATEVAPLTTARELALTMALRTADPLVSTSGSVVSDVPVVQKQVSGNVQVQVDPGSDSGQAAAKETTPQTAVSAAVQRGVVETQDTGDIRDLRELEEPLDIHASSEIEDSTPPVTKSKTCSGDRQKEGSHSSQARGSLKSSTFPRRATSGHQYSPGKRHQGSSEGNSYTFQKRFCSPQQRGRSPPRSLRPPNRNRRDDGVTLSAQEYEEFLRLRRHNAYR